MLATIDWIIIIVFILLSLGISLWYRQQAGKSLSNFFLGGRNLPWYIAGLSMVATTFAADTPLAVTELVAKNGIAGNWLWWSFLTGGMLTTFFFAKLWRRAEVLTEVELIELRYGGAPAKWLRGIKSVYLGLFMNVMVIGWVNLALKSILVGLFGIPDNIVFWYVAAAMGIATIYTSLSGLKGVAVTDSIQFFIAMLGTILLAVFVVNSAPIGGMSGLKQKLDAFPGVLNFFPTISSGADVGTATKVFGLSIGAFLAHIGIQWWSSWYPGGEPGGGGYVAQRMMSTRNDKEAVYSTLLFQIGHYCIRPWPWILVGLATLILYPGLEDPKLGYIYAIRDYLPVGVKGLLVTAFLAAYLSTISTQLNWGASYLVNDLYKRFFFKGDDESVLISASRLITVGLAVVGVAITTQMTSIEGVWSFIIEAGAGLGFVLILRWYWWRLNAWSEIVATITPFVMYGVSTYVLHWEFPNSFFLIVGTTILATLVVTYMTAPESNETLTSFYNKVKPQGAWKFKTTTSGNPEILDSLGSTSENFRPPDNSTLPWLALCWLSAVSMTYSILFTTGKLLFMEWAAAGSWAAVAVVSLILLRIGMSKTDMV